MAIPFYIPPPPPGSDDEGRRRFNALVKESFGGCQLETPKEGDLHVELRFARWPQKVCGKTIWLKHYEQLFEYKIRTRITSFYGRGVISWHGGGWDLISERICE